MIEEQKNILDRGAKVLVLGASGMLGNAVLRVFAQSPGFDVVGSARSTKVLKSLLVRMTARILCVTDLS